MTDFSIVDQWSENDNVFDLKKPDWHKYAKCKDEAVGLDIFFHERYHHAIREAKKLCAICPVRQACLKFAFKTDAVGIWGGYTTTERDKMNGTVRKKILASIR